MNAGDIAYCFLIACCIFSVFILWGLFLNNKFNKKKIMEKLPKKWYIAVTKESLDSVNKFRVSTGKSSLFVGEYPYVDFLGWRWDWGAVDGFKEITLDQFKRLVLKEDVESKEPSMEELLEEAKKRYPTGCTAMCVNGNHSTPFVVNQQYFKVMKKGITHGIWGIYQGNVGTGVWINLKGKWAEIVSLPESKDGVPEYVEALNTCSAFTKGKIYKTKGYHPQWKTDYAIVRDDNGSTTNGWRKDNWKPSTKEAYDAQFKTINDPIEKWKEEVRAKKFTNINELIDYIKLSDTTPLDIYDLLPGLNSHDKAKNLRNLLYIEEKSIQNEDFIMSEVKYITLEEINNFYPRSKEKYKEELISFTPIMKKKEVKKQKQLIIINQ